MRRTGIDLSSIRCNVVDAESSGRRRTRGATAFRVHHFASIPTADNPQTLTAELKALAASGSFPRHAWVNLWDVRSSHQYMLLPLGPEPELASTVRRHGASVLGMSDLDVTVSTSFGGTRGEPGHHPKREVSFFAAGTEHIRARLQPILDAGFIVEGVTTPCGALWSQARLRRASLPGEVHAHVALGASQSALGIFGDGSLLYARDLDWGHASHPAGMPAPQDREILATRLSTELRRSFLYLKQYWEPEVSQVLLCGDMPDVRCLTAPLIERLNVEVETLDTLEGIDASTLPDGFAELASTLRLASSIAVEPPPVNLLPVEVPAGRTYRSPRRIVAAGTAAAVAVGAFLYGRANVSRVAAEQELDAVRREIVLLPRGTAGTAPRLSDAQGPAMARVLEAVGKATPAGVTLRSLRVGRGEGDWHLNVAAIAAGDSSGARHAGERFLGSLAQAPFFGEPLEPTTRRVMADGVEIAATYRIRK